MVLTWQGARSDFARQRFRLAYRRPNMWTLRHCDIASLLAGTDRLCFAVFVYTGSIRYVGRLKAALNAMMFI